jgi:hypothetical protein
MSIRIVRLHVYYGDMSIRFVSLEAETHVLLYKQINTYIYEITIILTDTSFSSLDIINYVACSTYASL